MRGFLPIKGPGGRALTPKEKVALVVLGVTLVLCVLTLLAGEGAFTGDARNPVFALVSGLGGLFGGGIVGFYALVLVWSGLIYFKGERVADVRPFGGRLAAGGAVMVGISGALGIAHTQTAGTLGGVIGGALAGTLGGTLGIILLMGLVLLGIHLAGQGLWFALRESPAAAAPLPGHASVPFEAADHRMPTETPLPDDGDPSPDERTLAVTQAVEEIERSQGVTIVDVGETESEAEERASIGEQVEFAPAPAPETEEAEIQRGLLEVSAALQREREREAARVAAEEEEADEEVLHPLQPAPAVETTSDTSVPAPDPTIEITLGPARRDDPDEEPSDAVLEAIEREEDSEEEEEPATAEQLGFAYVDDDARGQATDDDEAEDEDEDADPNYYEPTYQLIDNRAARPENGADVDTEDETGEEAAEAGFAATPAALQDEADYEQEDVDEYEEEYGDEPADDDATEEGSDPYARGGLLRRLRQKPDPAEAPEADRYASFDWRGRPIE